MQKEDFPLVETKKPGRYRLIEEEALEKLLEGQAAQVLNFPSKKDLTLGYLVRNYREAKGWTQGDLANLIAIHPQSVAKLEGDRLKTKPERSTLAALSKSFGPRFIAALKFIGFQNEEVS